MSTELVPASEVLPARSLGDLAAQINAGDAEVERRARMTLIAAIEVGELLEEAASRIEKGWGAWCEVNLSLSEHKISRYRRLARNRDLLVHVIEDDGSIRQATAYLQTIPLSTPDRGGRRVVTNEMVARAEQLRADGASFREIAGVLGISAATIHRWIGGGNYARHRREMRERESRALLRQEARDKAVKRLKEPGGQAYTLLRRAEQLLSGAGRLYDPAYAKASKATEAIWEALVAEGLVPK